MTTTAWEPGIPLYAEHLHMNSRYLFNWRDSSEGPICNCADAARWPSPGTFWELGMGDELERFIAETRALRGAPFTANPEESP